MIPIHNFKKKSFLVYGLGLTGRSVINFFKKNNIKDYKIWDDKDKNLYKNKRPKNLDLALEEANYIILSPGISLHMSENKKKLLKFKKKIITDIDLIFLLKKFSKSIVVTGTNGKSTTCKIISHLLKKSKYKILLGGNIGTPILDLKIKKNNFLVIEASSFQLAHSKFIKPDYALLLNITNDHIDWHGSKKNYIRSKFKIFELQTKRQYSFIEKNFKPYLRKKNFSGKIIIPKFKDYIKIKNRIKNTYLTSSINDENMSYVFALSNLLKIKNTSFIHALNTFKGLPHRYEIFYKKKNCIFINDSKATSFQASKYALKNSSNIYWILGGLPKKNDKIIIRGLKKNIVKCYIIGKSINFFEKQIKKQLNYFIAKNLTKSIIQVLKDIKFNKKKNNTILFSPASASYDQFSNFEERGNKFKKLSKFYGTKYI